MDVDEAGTHHQARRVHHVARLLGGDLSRRHDCGDAIGVQRHIAAKPRVAGAVDHLRTAYEHIEVRHVVLPNAERMAPLHPIGKPTTHANEARPGVIAPDEVEARTFHLAFAVDDELALANGAGMQRR